jgi:hypothetical protein
LQSGSLASRDRRKPARGLHGSMRQLRYFGRESGSSPD